MQAQFTRVAESPLFQNFVTAVIILAGIVVGVETYENIATQYAAPLHWMNQVILGIFIVEIVVKLGAEGSKPWRYFLDPWNVFDFGIVALCLLPFGGSFVTVLRLLRVLRVLKLITALPKLQILVGALLKSIPSMFYVSMLLGLLFYLYAVTATFMFSANDPIHFENLQLSMLSLFRVVTLEDWTDIMYINMYGCENYGYDGNEHLCTASEANPVLSAAFFCSFVLFGTMVILNLFIGVIMNGMDEASAEAEELLRANTEGRQSLAKDLQELNGKLSDLQKTLAAVQLRAELEAERHEADLAEAKGALAAK